MTSAMARASTLSFMVTPHWCEIVSSNVMSFIDLKMLSFSCNMSVSRRAWLRGVGLVKGRWAGLRCEIGWNLQAKLGGDTLDAVLRMPQGVAECRDLDAWLRPDRLQLIGGIKCEVGMFDEPLVEQRNIMRAVSRIGTQDVEQLDDF